MKAMHVLRQVASLCLCLLYAISAFAGEISDVLSWEAFLEMAEKAPLEAEGRVLDMRGMSVASYIEKEDAPLRILGDTPLRIVGGDFGYMSILGGSLILEGTQVSVIEPDRRTRHSAVLEFCSIDDETPLRLTLTRGTSLSFTSLRVSDGVTYGRSTVLDMVYISAKDTQVELINHGAIHGLEAHAIHISPLWELEGELAALPHAVRIAIENTGQIITDGQGITVRGPVSAGSCDVSIHNSGKISGDDGGVDISHYDHGDDSDEPVFLRYSSRLHNSGEIFSRCENWGEESGAVAFSFNGEEGGADGEYIAEILNEGIVHAEKDKAIAVTMIAMQAKGSIDIRQDGTLQSYADPWFMEDYEDEDGILTDILLHLELGSRESLYDIRYHGVGEALRYPILLDYSTFDDWFVEGHGYTPAQAREKADEVWEALLENGLPENVPVRMLIGYWNIYEGQAPIYPYGEERVR